MLLSCKKRAAESISGQPGTFASLMDLYERNYMLIRRLAPELPGAGVTQDSSAATGLPLHLEVLDRYAYTSDIVLTYQFQRPRGYASEPNLQVRIYHDARVAEVMSAQLRHWPVFTHDEGDVRDLYRRWKVNRFLFKWLSYCLHQGHRFRD
jgi:uncharacterized protein YqiB (DUF1249 family)